MNIEKKIIEGRPREVGYVTGVLAVAPSPYDGGGWEIIYVPLNYMLVNNRFFPRTKLDYALAAMEGLFKKAAEAGVKWEDLFKDEYEVDIYSEFIRRQEVEMNRETYRD